MKLLRVGEPGAERPGVLVANDRYVDVSEVIADVDAEFLGSDGAAALKVFVDQAVDSGRTESLAGQRLGAPIVRPHQILCVGLNYRDHAAETGQPLPSEPIVFNKAPNTLVGPYDDLAIPPRSTATDWEVELGVVIGRRAWQLDSADDALRHIAGYVCVNDVSERVWQLERGGQWVKGKSAPTFNPCGPYLVTPDEVADVGALRLKLSVNGVRRQDGTTADLVFGVAHLVHYISQFMCLEPGDLINTGTPAGVGMGLDPRVYLQPGDVVELQVDGLGTQRQHVVAGVSS